MGFEAMLKEAGKVIDTSGGDAVATALLTDKGNLHIASCSTFPKCCNKSDDDFAVLDDIVANGDNRIIKMVTLYKRDNKYCGEVPCELLRQSIYEMNNENLKAEVMMPNEKIVLLKAFFPMTNQ